MTSKVPNLPPNHKLLYRDIISGKTRTSLDIDGKDTPIFIRHYSIQDELDSEDSYQASYDKCVSSGLITEAEKLKQLSESGEWVDKDDRDISAQEKFIENAKKTLSRLVVKAQKTQVQSQISDAQKSITEKRIKRAYLIGETCESVSSRVREDFLIKRSFTCLDGALLFSDEDFEYLDVEAVQFLRQKYHSVLSQFTEVALQKICLDPIFFNSFCLTDKEDIFGFFGARVPYDMSFFQQRLLYLGRHARYILENVPDVPDSARNDYVSLNACYDAYTRKMNNKGGKSTSGETSVDYKDKKDHLMKLLKESKSGKLGTADILS